MKPKILVTLDLGETIRRGVPLPLVEAKLAYARSIEQGGGVPLFVAPTDDEAVIEALLELLDGLVITGGAFDIEPERFGKTAAGVRVDPPKPLRTRFELALLQGALARGRAVLGVCGGMQLLDVALGGTLHLDIGAEIPGALEHEQPTSPALAAHPAELVEGSALAALLGVSRIEVNTTHHQAIERVAEPLRVSARAPDGVIEAVEHRERPEVIGVQWHPELMDDEVSRAIYADWIGKAARRG